VSLGLLGIVLAIAPIVALVALARRKRKQIPVVTVPALQSAYGLAP